MLKKWEMYIDCILIEMYTQLVFKFIKENKKLVQNNNYI